MEEQERTGGGAKGQGGRVETRLSKGEKRMWRMKRGVERAWERKGERVEEKGRLDAV